MFREVRFECGACGEGFVDWHEGERESAPTFCVYCGAAIVAGAPFEPTRLTGQPKLQSEARDGRALGVLKAEGAGFRDTLPGLKDEVARAPADAPDSSRDPGPAAPQSSTGRGSSQATSTAPRATVTSATVTSASAWAARRRMLGPAAALLLGFAAGIPAALLAENPVLRLMRPASYVRLRLSDQIALLSAAIDDGNWDQARDLLDRYASTAAPGDRRLAILRARLTLGLILANRPADAGRELAAVRKLPSGRLLAADLQRVYEALFPAKPSAATSNNTGLPQPAASTAPQAAKVSVTKRELLTFAHDRQRRSLLDDAQRLYAEVLRTHPNDAEARCGLAEVEILRGGVDDGARLFERALADDASYLPAWVGLADVDWLRGHPERAACRYQAVIDRFPAGSYPPYIRQRVEQVTHSGVNPAQARSDVSAAKACDD
jgi:tetratricopeptide (TPR) repeat protein